MPKPSKPTIRRPRRVPGRGPVISATDAAKSFGRLVDRVRETQTAYVIERGGTPVARIAPVRETSCTVADLLELFRSGDRLDDAYLDEVGRGVEAWNQLDVPGSRWER